MNKTSVGWFWVSQIFCIQENLQFQFFNLNKKNCNHQFQVDGFVGIAYQGKDILFRFIIVYSSLRDFGP
jgi:hypothetical protein